MANLIIKTKQDVEDLVRGGTFYGTGGGGLPENGIESLMSVLERKNEIVITDVDELKDDAVTACPFLMGSIAPHTPEVLQEMKGFGFEKPINNEKQRMCKAIKELERITNKQIDALIPIELAGANMPAAIAAACEMGKLVLNGDYTGRAIPEIQQTTPYLHGKKLTPITSVDEWDNLCIVSEATSYRATERIGKLISAGGYGLAGQAGFLLTGKETKEIIIKNTLTECYELGKFIREANESGLDPVEETIVFLGGYLVSKGILSTIEVEDRDGYYWGTHTINGIDEHQDKECKVWFKNENHICWINGKPIASSPDIIVIVDSITGEPLPNPLAKIGMEVSVIAIPARKEFRNEKGIGILSARYFGFDIDYIPIEETMSS